MEMIKNGFSVDKDYDDEYNALGTAYHSSASNRNKGRRIMRDEYDIVTLCDICKCEECPRYGDDCDGEFVEFEEFDDGEERPDDTDI